MLDKSFKHMLIRKKPHIHLFILKVPNQDQSVLESKRHSQKM